ncbi:MAG: hypothetical protein CL676_03310 [Bdellovibrionaceae bacterium]|nr:hypothetical protein [Pseudobdellovibrionaceae bacterium]
MGSLCQKKGQWKNNFIVNDLGRGTAAFQAFRPDQGARAIPRPAPSQGGALPLKMASWFVAPF